MSYIYKKLSDVDLVTSAANPNILIEDNGDIKKIPVYQISNTHVKADWEEDDANSPAFILNKPDLRVGSGGSSGGAKVITYTYNSGSWWDEDAEGYANASDFLDEWNDGCIINFQEGDYQSRAMSVHYLPSSGGYSLEVQRISRDGQIIIEDLW